jgi:hypothetical protein
VGRVDIGHQQAEPGGAGRAVVLSVANRVRVMGDAEQEEFVARPGAEDE